MRPLKRLLVTVAAVLRLSVGYSREGDLGHLLIDTLLLKPTAPSSQWRATVPTSNLVYQRELSENCSGTVSGQFEVETTNVTGSTDLEGYNIYRSLTLNNAVLIDGGNDNEIGYISADYQLSFAANPETGALETDGFSLCSNGSLAHQLDTTWYLCNDYGNVNIFARNVLPAFCGLIRLQVVGALPGLGSPITSTASSVQKPTTPMSSASHSSASTPPTSSKSQVPTPGSATLPTGNKVAIGVAVPVGVLGVAVVLYLIWRRRRRSSSASSPDTTTVAEWEKPELQDDSYDAAIAGPVLKKPELEAKSSHISELPYHSVHHIDSHEIAATVPTSSQQSGSSATQIASTSGVAPSRTASRPSGKSVPGTSTTRPQAAAEPSKAENHDELTEEYDTLISELGVISKRKKALNSAAATAGVRPEDLQGRRGAEYRQLTQREEGVRARMAEVQNALETNEG